MTASAHAWILTDASGHSFAVANVEMVEYLTEATTLTVPFSPAHCPAVMPWREHLIPVIMYHRLFSPDAAPPQELHHVGIIAYQRQPGEALLYLAVVLGQAPFRVVVSDEESEALPERYQDMTYSPLVRSVFCHDKTPIPVLDVNYLASATLRDLLRKKPLA